MRTGSRGAGCAVRLGRGFRGQLFQQTSGRRRKDRRRDHRERRARGRRAKRRAQARHARARRFIDRRIQQFHHHAVHYAAAEQYRQRLGKAVRPGCRRAFKTSARRKNRGQHHDTAPISSRAKRCDGAGAHAAVCNFLIQRNRSETICFAPVFCSCELGAHPIC